MAHQILSEIEELARAVTARDDYLLKAAELIQKHFPSYTWVGFYFLKDGRLHIGPYVGKPTPHTVIELNKGVCGAAVSRAETIIVDDVNSDPRYLACSLETKSEIVIPITVKGEIIGELDIDSDKLAAFNDDDRVLLEKVTELIGRKLEDR